MSDYNDGENKKSKLDQISEKPFFSFSKPYLDFIDKSKIYSLIYFVMAAINLVIPFIVLYRVIDTGFFKYVEAKYIFAFVLSWIVIVFACWIGFQLWWNRRGKVVEIGTSEFSATLIFSEILQTSGEWIGTLTGIIGAGVGLIAVIFLGSDINDLFRMIGMGRLALGPAVIVVGPIIGFSIIILFRFLAEQLRLFASLVNNTKEIAKNVKR
jgi:hypothetical protein